MKKFFAYLLNAYLFSILVGTLFLAHLVTYEKIELPSYTTKQYDPLPDFNAFARVDQKKDAFFSYFGEIVDDENDRVLAQRDALMAIDRKIKQDKALTHGEERIVKQLAQRYGNEKEQENFSIEQQISYLLTRVDLVPRSLALVQAAKESAWGTSRFALSGNNFFGQWCYKKGCGLVPLSRSSDAGHEVRKFPSPAASVRAYIFNINTHRAYQEFRDIRKSLRDADQELTGIALAKGLSRYSERGARYVAEVQKMIKSNKLNDQAPNLDEQLGTR